jgi:hypothetical protein
MYRVAVVRSGGTRINSAARWNFMNLSPSARLKAKIIYIISKATSCTYVKGLSANDAGEIIGNYSEQKLKKICFYDSLWSRGCGHLSHAECVMCMQRNGYSFTVFFRWTRFLLIWLVEWRALWIGAVCRGWSKVCIQILLFSQILFSKLHEILHIIILAVTSISANYFVHAWPHKIMVSINRHWALPYDALPPGCYQRVDPSLKPVLDRYAVGVYT